MDPPSPITRASRLHSPLAPEMSGARSLRFPAEYSVFVRSLVLP